MAASSPTPAAPSTSPVPTGWDEYLAELGLTREEQQELDSGKLSLDAFVDRKAREEARVNAAFYRKAEVDGDTDVDVFVNYVIEAIEQLVRHEDDRYWHVPCIPGVLEAWLIKWAEERWDELLAKQHKIWEAAREAERQEAKALMQKPELTTILEDEEYESED